VSLLTISTQQRKNLFDREALQGTLRKQAGFTMVELLVALGLSSLIALAAIAALVVSRQGFSSVDATSQLRDNARFTTDTLRRLIVQAGHLDPQFASQTRVGEFPTAGAAAVLTPYVTGVDNALVITGNLPDITTAYRPRPTATVAQRKCTSGTDTGCANGSDVLILRYQTAAQNPGGTVSDGSIIDCTGGADSSVPTTKTDAVVSIFHVAVGANGKEPSLYCSYFSASTLTWVSSPVIQGVESFQVLYGIDGFTTAVNTTFTGPQDTVPDKYVRASDLVVGTADSANTYSNWRRVRSLRIGLILRGSPNSNALRGGSIAKICPLGVNPDAATTCIDESGSESPSMGAEFPRKDAAVIPDDGRLRQSVTFTVFLRNVQNQ
jgi:type IV pilus assembly protein PilW